MNLLWDVYSAGQMLRQMAQPTASLQPYAGGAISHAPAASPAPDTDMSEDGSTYPQYVPAASSTSSTTSANPATQTTQQDLDAMALSRWFALLQVIQGLNSDPVIGRTLDPITRAALLSMAQQESRQMLTRAIGANNVPYAMNAMLQQTEGNPQGGWTGNAAPGPAQDMMARLIPERIARGQALVNSAYPTDADTRLFGARGWQQGGAARQALQNLPYYQQAAVLGVGLPEYGGLTPDAWARAQGHVPKEPTEAMWQAAEQAFPGTPRYAAMNGNPGALRQNGVVAPQRFIGS